MSLDIAQSNIDNLTLGVVPVFEVAGQVEWDGPPPHNDRLKEAAINLRFQYIGKLAADADSQRCAVSRYEPLIISRR